MEKKFCIKCKSCHSLWIGGGLPTLNQSNYMCFRLIDTLSLVTGEGIPLRRLCEEERDDSSGCGSEGKYWEAKK